ncbi:MAG: hypothetical protein EOO71_10220 [Myxococcaceae bacterium]|nr:MAG: hypothetical protein EOO71_10220 [Myxococcaceae bacterium]
MLPLRPAQLPQRRLRRLLRLLRGGAGARRARPPVLRLAGGPDHRRLRRAGPGHRARPRPAVGRTG